MFGCKLKTIGQQISYMATATLSVIDTHKQTKSTSQLKTNLPKYFEETTANTTFPNKEQAIVQNTFNDIAPIEHIKALRNIHSNQEHNIFI